MPADDSSNHEEELDLGAYWDILHPRRVDRKEGTLQPPDHGPAPFRDDPRQSGRSDEDDALSTWEGEGGACLDEEDEQGAPHEATVPPVRRSAWEHLDDDAFDD